MTPLMIGDFVTYATDVPLCHVRGGRSPMNFPLQGWRLFSQITVALCEWRDSSLSLSLSIEEIDNKGKEKSGAERFRNSIPARFCRKKGERSRAVEGRKGRANERGRKERKDGRSSIRSFRLSFCRPCCLRVELVGIGVQGRRNGGVNVKSIYFPSDITTRRNHMMS